MRFSLDTTVLPVKQGDFCAHCAREIKGKSGKPPRIYHFDGATYHDHCYRLVAQRQKLDRVCEQMVTV